jgi:hypothetical protein
MADQKPGLGKRAIKFVTFAGLYRLTFPHQAYAYLDPGSGSYFIQLTFASLLGVLVAIKAYGKRLFRLLTGLLTKRGGNEKGGN